MNSRVARSVAVLALVATALVGVTPARAGGGGEPGAFFGGNDVFIDYFLAMDAVRERFDSEDATDFRNFNRELERVFTTDDGTARAKTSNVTHVLLGEGDPQVEPVLLDGVVSSGSVRGSASGTTGGVVSSAESEVNVAFAVNGTQSVPYTLTGQVQANNSDSDDCTEALAKLEGVEIVFQRHEIAGGDCDVAQPSIGSASGYLDPGEYELDIALGGGVAADFAADNFSGSYNILLRLFSPCTHVLGDGGETVTGTSGDDVICGGMGDDTIRGVGGNDTIFGSNGDDDIRGGADADEIYGLNGKDTLQGFGARFGPATGENGDTIEGGPGDDTIAGGADSDFLFGEDGLDVIEGGPGDDAIDAGSGEDPDRPNASDLVFGMCFDCRQSDLESDESDDDLIVGGEGPDRVLAGPGRDSIFGNEGKDELAGEQGDEISEPAGEPEEPGIEGGEGKDVIEGGSGDDFAAGGPGNDAVRGEGGRDKLLGQGGEDEINGGGGRDVLEGGDRNDSLNSRDCQGDSVSGGAGGSDTAKVDERDAVSGVEGSVGIRC